MWHMACSIKTLLLTWLPVCTLVLGTILVLSTPSQFLWDGQLSVINIWSFLCLAITSLISPNQLDQSVCVTSILCRFVSPFCNNFGMGICCRKANNYNPLLMYYSFSKIVNTFYKIRYASELETCVTCSEQPFVPAEHCSDVRQGESFGPWP